MKKNGKSIFLFILLFFCIYNINAEPLNSRTAFNCIQQVDRFINDFESYFEIQITVVGITGRIRDNNQINITERPNSLHVELLYNNEVMMIIHISKSARRSNNDSVEFSYSQNLGFRTVYTKSYDQFDQLGITVIFYSLFEAFGLL